MAIEILIVGALAAGAAALFATAFPTLAGYIVTARMILAALAAIISAAILISTNVMPLMILGGAIVFILVLNYYALDTGTAVW